MNVFDVLEESLHVKKRKGSRKTREVDQNGSTVFYFQQVNLRLRNTIRVG